MSPASILLFLLLLCLSQHACSVRSFGVTNKETITVTSSLQLSHKNIEPPRTENLARFGRKTTLPSWDGANTFQEKSSQTLGKENEDNKADNVVLPSPQKALYEKTKLEDQKGQARSTMESPANEEETLDSMENEMGEDIVVMDYAQPHRKPPIHNWEP